MGQLAITERPPSLDERGPRPLVTSAIDRETTGTLELSKCCLGAVAKPSVFSGTDRKRCTDQSTLEVSDRLAAITEDQWELLRNEPNSSRRADLLFAPTIRCTGWPSANTIIVGMLIT